MDEPSPFSSCSLLIAAGATALCCIYALWALRSNAEGAFRRPRRKKLCGCSCSCGVAGSTGGGDCDARSGDGDMAVRDNKVGTAERQAEFRTLLGAAATEHLHLPQHDYTTFPGAEALAATSSSREARSIKPKRETWNP